jgi:hypothetical protein
MTLRELINNTHKLFPKSFFDTKQKVYKLIKHEENLRMDKDLMFKFTVKSPNDTYELRIRFLDIPDKQKPKMSNQVRVYCSCQAFAFTLEYALLRKKALDSTLSVRNAAPREKNPLMMPALCKHLYGMAANLTKRQFIVNL